MNKKIMSLVSVVCSSFLIVATGCTTTGGLSSNFLTSPAYQARDEIQESLFASDRNVLSNEAIDVILRGRVVLPQEVHLAVLPLGSTPDVDISDELFAELLVSPHIAHASYLPFLMVPKNATISHLREAAARTQANLLFVYKDWGSTFTKYRFAAKDETRAYCTVEAVLLDVRTGIVPFSTLVTEESTLKRSSDDFGSYETREKARTEAFRLSLLKAVAELKTFLDSLR